MKIYKLLLVLSIVFISCNEENVPMFTDKVGVNFMQPAGDTIYTDGYTNINRSIDFFNVYASGLYGVNTDTIQVRVKLEGKLGDVDLKVNFKVEADSTYPMPEVILPTEAVIVKAGDLTANAYFVCVKPSNYNVEHRAKILMDYANSDVVAGTEERQEFEVIVNNSFSWEKMSVTSREEWDKAFVAVLGEYGEEKVRFLLSALGSASRLEDASWYTANDYYPQYYGLQKYMPSVKEKLETYNAEHPDSPVKEADGTLVTFP